MAPRSLLWLKMNSSGPVVAGRIDPKPEGPIPTPDGGSSGMDSNVSGTAARPLGKESWSPSAGSIGGNEAEPCRGARESKGRRRARIAGTGSGVETRTYRARPWTRRHGSSHARYHKQRTILGGRDSGGFGGSAGSRPGRGRGLRPCVERTLWREVPGPAARAVVPDPGRAPCRCSQGKQTARQPTSPWSSPPSRSGRSTPATNSDLAGLHRPEDQALTPFFPVQDPIHRCSISCSRHDRVLQPGASGTKENCQAGLSS